MGDRYATGVSYDSREVRSGDLFVCIKGEKSDGHDFAADALKKNAAILLAERPLPDVSAPTLIVKNSIEALGKIAHAWRKRTSAKVIGITGTCGKTTLKEMLGQSLSSFGKTAMSRKNHNNQLGLAWGMLNTDGDEDYWVFELGISHPGDMEELASVLLPDIGLILNVGPGHTEGLGDMGVAWHKTRLLLHLAEGGKGVLSADYPELLWKALGTHVQPLYFFSGKQGVPNVNSTATDSFQDTAFAVYKGEAPDGLGIFSVYIEGLYHEVRAPLNGEYAAENVVAAVLLMRLLDLPMEGIQSALPRATLPPQRCSRRLLGSFTLIDDTYNANPLSMERMLKAAKSQAGEAPFYCVLGEMRELGKDASSLHRDIGTLLAKIGPSAVFWKGGEGDAVLDGFKAGGGQAPFVFISDPGEFMNEVRSLAATSQMDPVRGGTILFKGSRANALEKFVDAFSSMIEGEGHVL